MRDLSHLTAIAARGWRLEARGGSTQTARWGIRCAAATAEGRTPVYVYDVIGDSWMGGVTAGDFVQQLADIGDGGIDLHINSPGGSVFDGVAMYSALLNHPSDVTSYVDGIAASAASFLAMAGDRVEMEKPAKMMIHNASGLVLGQAKDMREMADLLDEVSGTIAQVYTDRAGGKLADWQDAMDNETWYSAQAAVDAGLADVVRNNDPGTRSGSSNAPEDRRTQLIRARARVALKGA